jgi:hypothetical protein
MTYERLLAQTAYPGALCTATQFADDFREKSLEAWEALKLQRRDLFGSGPW